MFKLEIKPSEKIHTCFGNAKVYDNKYYIITSRKNGKNSQALHRLIFERFYGEIPKGYEIHHKDGNKTNNCIMNLQLVSHLEHSNLHNKGKLHSKSHMMNISKFNNTTGYFRVDKAKDKTCEQGFLWRYRWHENGKRKSISRVSLEDLEREVKNRGLEWERITDAS